MFFSLSLLQQLPLPHGIAAVDHNGSSTGGLSFQVSKRLLITTCLYVKVLHQFQLCHNLWSFFQQKNEVLLLLEEVDLNTFECQVGGTRGRAQKSHMKIITPLDSASPKSSQQVNILILLLYNA